jgi:hypothetical protein
MAMAMASSQCFSLLASSPRATQSSLLLNSSVSPCSRFSYRTLPCLRTKKNSRNARLQVVSQQTPDAEASDVGAAGVAAIAGGLIANPVVAWSLFTLKTTGCGLPPGPGGAIGAVEGVSYLVILGVIGWSTYSKVKTGSGLPSGPYGLLGAVEGLSFLSVLAILVVFGLQYVDYGFIPGPVPSDLCFGSP